MRAFFRAFVDVVQQVAATPVPTMAAVDGPAIAGGGVLALATDLRIVNQQARMALTEVTVGIPYPPLALEICEQALPRQEHVPALLAATEREGEELVTHGWAHDHVDAPPEKLIEQARRRAQALAAHDARTLADIKQSLQRTRSLTGTVSDEAIETYVDRLVQAGSLEQALERAQA